MAEIVNLRQLRKSKAREAKEKAADQNRALHGRSKLEKLRDKHNTEAARAHLDAHRLQPKSETPEK